MATKTEQTQPTGGDAGGQKGTIPIVVKVKPGTAAEKSVRFVLPEDMATKTIDQVVDYVRKLGEDDGLTRESLRIQDRLGIEMRDKYGITVNGQGLTGGEKISDYLKEQVSPGGMQYKEAEIIVAARQEGAYRSYW